ncbi:hypothetical protein LIER_34815 [Lithospermum erythrorhizon]|uniref:Uncharacterized protein n=1 Tax=Lithospermum erythrorhizon TaxID=34254 RepID=A0AAV3S3S3_LITER
MESSRYVEDKSPSSPRSEQFKRSKSRNQKSMMNNILEAISQVNSNGVVYHTDAQDGTRRMKIVMKKEDLKQVLELVKDGGNVNNNNCSVSGQSHPSVSLEQRLNVMRKRQTLRASCQPKLRNGGSWNPVLQSIPE